MIPDEWSEVLVKDAFKVGRGRVISKPEIRDHEGIYPVYSSQSKDHGKMGSIATYDFDGEYITWTTDGAYAGTVFYRIGKFNCTNVCGTLKDNRAYELDVKFVSMYLGTIAKNHVSYVGNPKLMNNTFSEILFLAPPIPEQKKIAAILTSVDEAIEKQQSQISKLQDLKKAMMQELLTKGIGHTEFKDSLVGRIPVGWAVATYDSVLMKIDSGWSPSCVESPPNIGEWGVLKVSAVTRGKFIELESKTLPATLEPRQAIKVKNGDILLTRANGVANLVGKCVKVNGEPKRKLMMSDKILRLLPRKNIYSDFLLHVFNSRITRNQIEQSWGGSSGQKNISKASVKSFLLPLPPIKEQQAIASSITSIDDSIEAMQRKLIHIKSLKKSLMQDLLTGKVRVKV